MQGAYELLVNLRTDDAITLLKKVNDPQRQYYRTYIESLAECIDILITENEAKFIKTEEHFKSRLAQLDDQPESADKMFLQAELNLQLGFCYLNLSQQFYAILAIRKAYNLVKDCMKKYPNYIPVRKTSGVIQVMIGAVPDKYHLFISMLGMEGSVATGQQQLGELRNADISLSKEANILYYTIKGLINQQFSEASAGFSQMLTKDPDNRLISFLAINMMMKNFQSESALKLIRNLDLHHQGLSLVYLDYLRAEILLQKGEYSSAILAYQRFMANYKGSSFRKDATYKTALAWHLSGKPEQAKAWWEKARKTGKAVAEPDVYADHALNSSRMPHAAILKVRLLTDGGYFKEARTLLAAIPTASLVSEEDKTELIYRKARLSDKTGETATAQSLYLKTIELSGKKPWYFGASSALQLGYLYRRAGDLRLAKTYFEKALDYGDHAYKNSIDGKAKSALDELRQIRN